MPANKSERTFLPASGLLFGCIAFWAMETALSLNPSSGHGWWSFRLYALAWYCAWGLLMDPLALLGAKLSGIVEDREYAAFKAVFYWIANTLLVFTGILLARQANLWPALLALLPAALGLLLFRMLINRVSIRVPLLPSVILFNLALLCAFAYQRGWLVQVFQPAWWVKVFVAVLLVWALFKIAGLVAGKLSRIISPSVNIMLRFGLSLLIWLGIAAENRLYKLDSYYPMVTSRSVNSESTAEGPNIVFVLFDCLRADRLGCYGHSGGLSPNIDRFADNAALFSNAYANAPLTRASVATIFTGLYPHQHGVLTGRDFLILPDSLTTLAETIASRGYHTASLVAGNPNVSAWGNYDQGFDEFIYYDSWLLNKPYLVLALQRRPHYMDGQRLTNHAIEWLAGSDQKQPFMLYIHYMDNHKQYFPPPDHPVADSLDYSASAGPDKLYNNQVRLVDYEFGRLLRALKSDGLDRNTVVMLTSDHGESLGEHDREDHGSSLYQQQIHVPLIVRIPGSDVQITCDRLTGLIDIPGMVLAATEGADGPCEILPERDPEMLFSVLYREDRITTAVIYQYWKLIHRESGENSWELYNLADDPGETANMFFEYRELAEKLREELLLFEQDAGKAASHSNDRRMNVTPQEIERLKALGYIK